MTAVFVLLEVVWGRLSTQVAVDALIIHIAGAGRILRIRVGGSSDICPYRDD